MRKMIVAAASAALMTATVAVAQDAPQQDAAQDVTQQAPAEAATSFSDEELLGYARAVEAIQPVVAQLEPGTAPNEEQTQELAQRVEASGISVQQFNAIAQALQSDPALGQRIVALVQAQGEAAPQS